MTKIVARALAVSLLMVSVDGAPQAVIGVGRRTGMFRSVYVAGCQTYVGTATTKTCAISGVNAGDVILFEAVNANAAVPTLTDSNSGTISSLPSQPTIWNTSGTDYQWKVVNAGAGTHTLTLSYASAPSGALIQAMAFTGVSSSAPVDSAAFASGSGTSLSCGSVATSRPNEMIVSLASGTTSVLTAGTSPQAMNSAFSSGYLGGEYGFSLTSGTTTHAEWTSASQPWVCSTIGLK